MTAPIAPKRPHLLADAVGERIDEYYWLRDRNDPEVTEYIRAENRYYTTAFEQYRSCAERLFEEYVSRIREDETLVSIQNGPYFYYTRVERGKQYRIQCRKRAAHRALLEGVAEEILFDPNEMPEASGYLSVTPVLPSPSHRMLAVGFNTDGSDRYEVRFYDTHSQSWLPDRIGNCWHVDGFVWADDRSLLYLDLDETQRPYRCVLHRIGSSQSDRELFREGDLTRRLRLVRGRAGIWAFLYSFDSDDSEVYGITLSDPEAPPQLFHARIDRVMVQLEYWGGNFYKLSNERSPYFDIVRTADLRAPWEPFIPAHPQRPLLEMEPFVAGLLVSGRSEGFSRQWLASWHNGGLRPLTALPSPSFGYVQSGRDPLVEEVVVRAATLATPMSSFSVSFATGAATLVQQDYFRSHDPNHYVTEKIVATARDGALVPISYVRRKDTPPGPAPTLIIGYGAYGACTEPLFRPWALSVVDRGGVLAIAHVRGGGEFGRPWYEQGRLLQKMTTFTDFIACTEHLISIGLADRSRIGAWGGSAGGLLMGAICNLRPDLYRVVLADVPFVDVVTTMSDPTIPLTTSEYSEWGNPAEKDAYKAMVAYSPYDNVREDTNYPALFVTAGMNDPRVPYWEPLKWVAKLRAQSRSSRPLLLRMHLDGGHGGSSGRYARWREIAESYAFLLVELGIYTGTPE